MRHLLGKIYKLITLMVVQNVKNLVSQVHALMHYRFKKVVLHWCNVVGKFATEVHV